MLVKIPTVQSFSGSNAIDTATLTCGLVVAQSFTSLDKSFLFSPPGAHQAWHYCGLCFAAALRGHPHYLEINTATRDNEESALKIPGYVQQ